MIRSDQGFTLIELLIVIVIIGILSGVLITGLNPIDQVNKAQDQSKKVTAVSIIGALERYYVNYERYPWDAPSSLGVAPAILAGAGNVNAYFINVAGTNQAWLDGVATGNLSLISTGELKPDIAKKTDLQSLKIYKYGTGAVTNLIRICFRPEASTAIANAKYLNGDINGACPANASCQVCLPE